MIARALRWSRRAEVPVADTAPALDEMRFRDLYQRCARPVWGYLRRVTGDASVADDLLQDTFCRLLTSGPADADPEAMRGWLFRVASNLAMDHFRREGRAPRALDEVAEPQVSATPRDVLAARAMHDTLARLEPRERAMLWLAYVEDVPHREIATAVGVREGSVRVLLFRAKQKLAGLLARVTRDTSAAAADARSTRS